MTIPSAIPLTRHRFTVAEYYKMAEAGILGEDDRVELIDGKIIDIAPSGPAHAWCVTVLIELFSEGLRQKATVWPQNPLRLSEQTEP